MTNRKEMTYVEKVPNSHLNRNCSDNKTGIIQMIQSERTDIYLEEINGRVATTKNIHEWRYLLAL